MRIGLIIGILFAFVEAFLATIGFLTMFDVIAEALFDGYTGQLGLWEYVAAAFVGLLYVFFYLATVEKLGRLNENIKHNALYTRVLEDEILTNSLKAPLPKEVSRKTH